MATYIYKCAECGKEKKERHGMTEEPRIPCPDMECTGIMHRVPQSTPFIAKCDGFCGTSGK